MRLAKFKSQLGLQRSIDIIARSGVFDLEYYSEFHSFSRENCRSAIRHYLLKGDRAGLAPSPLFDRNWYIATYPDVIASGEAPLLHFLLSGVPAGYDPHPLFNTNHYRSVMPKEARIQNPLGHYLRIGGLAGLDPHPLFLSAAYLERNGDVAAANLNPLVHYIRYGRAERRAPLSLFDSEYYLTTNPDVAASGLDPFVHYVRYGAGERRNPHPLFDASHYLRENPDIAMAGVDPLSHYLQYGGTEGRDPHPLFSGAYYLEKNPDVRSAGVNPLVHYLSSGAFEGRDPHRWFNSRFYLSHNCDVLDARINPLVHYVRTGASEGRDPHPEFSTEHYLVANALPLAAGDALAHFIAEGERAGRRTANAAHANRRWSIPRGKAWRESFELRLNSRLEALRTKNLGKPTDQAGPTFSITTTVYDTDRKLLDALAETVKGQAFADFEWLILDNGSTNNETIEACKVIAASDPRFILHRVPENLHIIGGNRFLLERATGSYIVPTDSDDLLYRDSLALIADVIREEAVDLPAIIYSDEQKISLDGQPVEIIWRNAYSYSHALSTVPAAHLLVFRRDLALAANLYDGDYARGSHDWDSALRLTENGGRARHIPEVLYGWRMHSGSTAADIGAKDYILSSQLNVVQHSLIRRGLNDQFDVVPTFEGVPGYFSARRRLSNLPELEIDFVVPWEVADFGTISENLRLLSATPARRRILYPSRLDGVARAMRGQAAFAGIEWVACKSEDEQAHEINRVGEQSFAKTIISAEIALRDPSAVVEAVGLLELDVAAGIVGGSIVRTGGVIQSVGLLAGLDGLVGSPFYGWRASTVPPHFKSVRRPVSVMHVMALTIRASLLRAGLRIGGIDRRDALNGVGLCLEAERRGYLTILDGASEGQILTDLEPFVAAGLRKRRLWADAYCDVLARRVISHHLDPRGARFGSLAVDPQSNLSTARAMAFSPPATPLNVRLLPEFSNQPTINLLLPAVRRESLSGGPNTALNIAYRLASRGFAVRLISTDAPSDQDHDFIQQHMRRLVGTDLFFDHLTIVDGYDRSEPLNIGANDVFFATAWWTAVMAHAASVHLGGRPFIYLIQDFEPIFYPASSAYAEALESYGLPHIPVINSGLLCRYLLENKIGLFADPVHGRGALPFEPAIDRAHFYTEFANSRSSTRKRRLLFYARPGIAARNLFEIGVAALKAASNHHVLGRSSWEIVGMGEDFEPIDLGNGNVLACAEWLGFEAYARQMRESDILLSLMLSPHPSYPPLEMAGCGGLVVTNVYANKSADAMAAVSDNIIAVEPTVSAIFDALVLAIDRLDDTTRRAQGANLSLPASWDESLETVIDALGEKLVSMGIVNDALERPQPRSAGKLALPSAAHGSNYEYFLRQAAERRALNNQTALEPGLLSLVTTVWNTPRAFLDVLARSVEAQAGGHAFEWLILDNGSTASDTRAYLQILSRKSYVRLERVEGNLGIIGGMRWCLENASGRYILPLDSDDYLYEDCLRTITWHLQRANYPALSYTDEDKLTDEELHGAFLKPDFDPVLFQTQCFIAHLCAIDRVLALEVGAYLDAAVEGSHDWDTFTRFQNAGYTPHHVPEILYSWRIHPQSTSGNIDSKPVVYSSQKAVITRRLAGIAADERFSIANNPRFGSTPDWWVRRRRVGGRPIATIIVGGDAGAPEIEAPGGLDHRIIHLPADADLTALGEALREIPPSMLVHLLSGDAVLADDEWGWEAIGLIELFPDTVVVGGLVRDEARVLAGGGQLGFDHGFGHPDRHRPLHDPGYAAEAWKHRSVGAVSAMNAVFDRQFLEEVVAFAAPRGGTVGNLGAWAGGVARRIARRIVYSPIFMCTVTRDWEALVSADERGAVAKAFGALMPERSLISRYRGLAAGQSHLEVSEPWHGVQALAGVQLPDLRNRLERAIAAGRTRGLADAADIRFSLLTTLYIGTDADFFARTACATLASSHLGFEWILLVHGTISNALRDVLRALEHDKRVIMHELPDNLGIIGGMKFVLDRAEGEYVVPLDSDDLLTSDALAMLAEHIVSQGERPGLVYSDEDIIVDETVVHRCVRMPWDPILDLENSWIWHAVAFRRDLAVELGVYTDAQAEYCHDWDTVDRFAAAGHIPSYVPAILYHWRHHAGSTSNSETENLGSSQSVLHVLRRKIARSGLDGEVEPYPIWRGAREWWIMQKRKDAICVLRIVNLPDAYASVEDCLQLTTSLSALADRLSRIDEPWIALVDHSAAEAEPDLREALKIFDFVPDTVAVTGRALHQGKVVATGLIEQRDGLQAPHAGLAIDAPGEMALALKPHTVTVPTNFAILVSRAVLLDAIAAAPGYACVGDLDTLFAGYARAKGGRIGFAPTFAVTCRESPPAQNAGLAAKHIAVREFERYMRLNARV